MGTGEGINFVEFYLRQLVSGTPEQKNDAAEGLAREFTSGSPPQELLNALRIQVSHGQSLETVSHSMRLLCGFGDKHSIRTIIKRLASEPGKTRSALEGEAVSSIGIFGGAAFPELYQILASENDSAACSVTLSLLMKSPSPAHIAPIAGLLGRLHSSHLSSESGNSPMAVGVKKEDPDWGTIQGNSFMAAILAVEALAKIGNRKSTDALFAYVGRFTGDEKPPYSDVLFTVFDVLFSSSGNIRKLGNMGLPPKVSRLLLSFMERKWEDSEPLPQGAPAAAQPPENLAEIQGFFDEADLEVSVPSRPPPPPGDLKKTQEFRAPQPPRRGSLPAFAPPPARDNGPDRIPRPPRAVRGPTTPTPTKNIRPPTYPVKR